MGPLLETKFHIPSRRGIRTARPRLTTRAADAARASLTLVSAPAGFGKTTLLAEWMELLPDGIARSWLSLDGQDNDLALFWTYVITAAQKAVGNDIASGALASLQGSSASVEAAISMLLNELLKVPGDVVLALDDYHVIESPDVHESVAFLLARLPPHVHLVMATRADPPLPLGRLRAPSD